LPISCAFLADLGCIEFCRKIWGEDYELTLRCLNDIINHVVNNGGYVYAPERGIPLRSSLSPFLGALYLVPLDRALGVDGCVLLPLRR
jgi:hypothetical protein